MSAHQLLSKLLDYVLEQAKDIDPRGFNLSAHKGFKKSKPDLQGLPGVDFDIKLKETTPGCAWRGLSPCNLRHYPMRSSKALSPSTVNPPANRRVSMRQPSSTASLQRLRVEPLPN